MAGQKQCHPNEDEHDSEVTKKRDGSGDMTSMDASPHVVIQMICLGITV